MKWKLDESRQKIVFDIQGYLVGNEKKLKHHFHKMMENGFHWLLSKEKD